jgi:Glycosyl transferase family 2
MTVNKPATRVSVSVVVPAYRSWATLPLVLAALRDEVVGEHREAILVESSGEFPARTLEARWPWMHIITPPERANPGRARNIGVAAARGDKIAFLDSDAIAELGWLDALETALTDNLDAVVGGIVNGTPRSATGTAGYLLEFSDWLPRRRNVPLHGVTCNLLIRRNVLEQAGGLPDPDSSLRAVRTTRLRTGRARSPSEQDWLASVPGSPARAGHVLPGHRKSSRLSGQRASPSGSRSGHASASTPVARASPGSVPARVFDGTSAPAPPDSGDDLVGRRSRTGLPTRATTKELLSALA